MKTIEEICSDIKEREQFHLNENKILNDRCNVLSEKCDKLTVELNKFREHIRMSLEQFVDLANRGIVRDSIIRDFYKKEFANGSVRCD